MQSRILAVLAGTAILFGSGISWAGAGSGSSPCGFGIYRDLGGNNKFLLDHDQDGVTDVSFEFGPTGSDVYVGAWAGAEDNVAVRVEKPAASNLGKFFFNTDSDPQDELAFTFGTLDDPPVVGRFGGTTTSNVGVKRNVGGVAKYFLDATSNGAADIIKSFNTFTDTTVIGNWDGMGRDNIGTVKVVGAGLKWILENDDSSVTRVNFGTAATDIPIPGDFDGMGGTDLAVVRDIGGGNTKWLIDTDLDGIPDESFNFGTTSDTPSVCDWDGNGTDDPGYFETEPGKLFFITNEGHTPGGITLRRRFGSDTDSPIVGVWALVP